MVRPLKCMISADPRLPSQLHSVTAHLWPSSSYTAWWQGHNGVNNLH